MLDKPEGKRVLLADGPVMICELNPKAAERFSDRVCEVCNQPILTHWIVPSNDAEKRASYWCFPDNSQECTGMKI